MKKLMGMKKNVSSLENKKLKDLTSVTGGKRGSSVVSNWVIDSGGPMDKQDVDRYDSDGNWIGRDWVDVPHPHY